jgi:hypothetical protein
LCADARRFVVTAHARDVMATLQWGSVRAEHPELLEALLHTIVHDGEPPTVIAGAGAQPAGTQATRRLRLCHIARNEHA